MSSPRAIIQIVLAGAQIFGKAFAAAGRQAMKNAQHRPTGALSGDAAGVGNATSGSMTDKLTREHRMTLDEAHLVLNTKRTEPFENVLKNYELLFKANSPPPPPEKPATGGRPQSLFHSHYLQSKVFRARERIEAENKSVQAAEKPPASASAETPPPKDM